MRGLQIRSEQLGEGYAETIWSFRVERYDDAGNRVLLVPLEMRGRTFQGSIQDGDWVRARGRMRHGTFRADLVVDLTTGAVVRAKGYPVAAVVAIIIFFVAIAVVIGWVVFSSLADGAPGPVDVPSLPNGGPVPPWPDWPTDLPSGPDWPTDLPSGPDWPTDLPGPDAIGPPAPTG